MPPGFSPDQPYGKTHSMPHPIARALSAACLLAAAVYCPPAEADEAKVVATVNGQSITEMDLSFADQEVGADLGSVAPEMKRRYLLEYLIETELLAAAAKAEKLDQGPDFESRLSYMKKRAMRDAYFNKAVRGAIDDTAAQIFYDQQIKMMKPEEEVQARHILVASEADATAIAQKIAGGADFAALAKESSTDAGSKEDGGNLGYFGRGQMVPQFEQTAFALKKGEVSKPVQSQFGWHIIKLEDRRQKPPPAFEQIKGQIFGALIKQQAEQQLGGLRGKAKIEYVDPDIRKQVEDDAKAKDALEAQMREMREKMQKGQQQKKE